MLFRSLVNFGQIEVFSLVDLEVILFSILAVGALNLHNGPRLALFVFSMTHIYSALIFYNHSIRRLLEKMVAELFEFRFSIVIDNHVEAALSILFLHLRVTLFFAKLLAYQVFD